MAGGWPKGMLPREGAEGAGADAGLTAGGVREGADKPMKPENDGALAAAGAVLTAAGVPAAGKTEPRTHT